VKNEIVLWSLFHAGNSSCRIQTVVVINLSSAKSYDNLWVIIGRISSYGFNSL